MALDRREIFRMLLPIDAGMMAMRQQESHSENKLHSGCSEQEGSLLIAEDDNDNIDPLERNVEDGVALSLLGGAYRAMLFHVGVLWRLNEMGFLPKIERFSIVSGGSITAAVLGLNWYALGFNPAGYSEILSYKSLILFDRWPIQLSM